MTGPGRGSPLVVHPHFHPRRTGITAHLEAVVPLLARRMEVRVLGTTVDPRLPRIRPGELAARLRRGPVVWHAHRNPELATGLALPGIRTVVTRHAAGSPTGITRLLAGRADLRISLTPEESGRLPGPVRIVGHGVDLDRFRPPADRGAAWRRLGRGGERGVGVVGRIRPEKGQGDFLAAARPLLAERSGWVGVLLGRRKARHAGWLRRAGGEELLVGEVADPVPWFQGLSVVVQPSRSEGFSLVVLEGMAAGCCVVAARLPHLTRLIEHGRTGFLYPPAEVGALRAVLERLLDDPELVARVGAAAAAEARHRFGLDAEVAALAGIYRELAEASPPGPVSSRG